MKYLGIVKIFNARKIKSSGEKIIKKSYTEKHKEAQSFTEKNSVLSVLLRISFV
jgi:hypothetical protein